jgi:tetratricopeptide (TPR) repeat protein
MFYAFIPLSARAEDYVYVGGKGVTSQFIEAAKLVNQANALMRENKVEEALKLAEQSVKLAPESVFTHLVLAGAMARSGNLDGSLEECKKAQAIDSSRPEIWMNLGNIYLSSGKTSEALETLREYLKKFPHDTHYDFIKSQVAVLEREQKMYSKESPTNADDYFGDATVRGIMKWNKDKMPLAVYLESTSCARGFDPSFVEEAKRCFSCWQDASGGKVQFKFIEKPDSADIDFRWTDNAKDVSQPAEGGETRIQPSLHGIESAKIKVLTVSPVKELRVDDALIRFTCMHEIGHALGIAGHSHSRGDVMFCSLPLNFQKCALSDRDVKTLQHLYSDDVVISLGQGANAADALSNAEYVLNQEAQKQFANGNPEEGLRIYKEAYAKNPESHVFKHNLCCALQRIGIEALKNQNLDKAASMFKESLEIEPDDRTAKVNLGVALLYTGMQQSKNGKLAEAEPNYKQAIELFTDTDKTRLAVAVHNYANYLTRIGKTSEAKELEAKYQR